MPDTTLHDLVLKRLDAATKPEDAWSALVLSALESAEELESLLEGPSAPLSFRGAGGRVGGAEESAGAGPLAPSPPPRIAFLKAIAVEGFRGIGPKATLDLTPGPGLTGLHHPKAAIAAEFALEGEKGTCTVARERQDGPDLDAATTWAQVHGQPCAGQEALAISTKPQLICLQVYLMGRDLAGKANDAWSNLTQACDHHPYELAASRSELVGWLRTVTDVLAVVPPRKV